MKRLGIGLLILIFILILQACNETIDPNWINQVQLSFDEELLEVTTLDSNITISTDDLGDVLSVKIQTEEPFYFNQKTKVYVNDLIVNVDLLAIDNQEIVYAMLHPNPQNPLEYVNVDVTFDPNGGMWNKEIINSFEPHYQLTITAKNDLSGTTFSLFDNEQTQLRWYYKLFLSYNELFEAYEVVYSDPSTASIYYLDLPAYDYVIGVHLHTTDIEARDIIIDLTTHDERPMFITFDKDLSTYESGDLITSIWTEDQISGDYQKTMFDVETLPVPYLKDFTFLGWSDGTNIHQMYPRYQRKDHIQTLTYTAVWGSKSVEELTTYLSSLIMEHTDDNLTLPASYSGYSLVWESSAPDVISSSGIYKRPYVAMVVTLSVTATLGEESQVLTFDTAVDGYKSLEGPIASSYIYRNFDQVTDDFFEILDIINGAFVTAQGDGSLIGAAFLNNMQTYILPKAKQYGNWVIPSIAPDSAWSEIASSTTKLNHFADSIVELINTYGFDGVDIDWETPTPGEETRYTELMRVVYTKVKENNPNHLVTTAIAGGMWQPPRYDLVNSKQYIDYINMMTYGMVGTGAQYQNALYKASTYHNTTFNVGKTLTSCSIDESVKMYKANYQVNYDQIIVGVAFYGMRQTRTFNQTTQTWSTWVQAGSVHYTEIANTYNGNSAFIKAYDQRAGVPYILKNDGSEFISYDNPKSILEKSAYIIDQGLAGMMYWENGHDTTGDLLTAIRTGFMK